MALIKRSALEAAEGRCPSVVLDLHAQWRFMEETGWWRWTPPTHVVAALAKAGGMPLHSWVLDCGEKAPVTVTAFLPASLDKLLGIYLLARVATNMFVMNTAMNGVLLLLGFVGLPLAIYIVGQRIVGEYAADQGVLDLFASIWGAVGNLSLAAWLLVLSPYVVISLLRLSFATFRSRRSQPE